MDPFEKTRTDAQELKTAYDAKNGEAKQKWAAFERERKRLVEAGVDAAKNASALRELERLHDDYKTVADEAQHLHDRLMRSLDLTKGVAMGDTPGAIFAKNLERQGIDFKAVTTGGSIVPATFDTLIRALPQRQLRLRNLVNVDAANA